MSNEANARAVYLALDKEVRRLGRLIEKYRLASIEMPIETDRRVAEAMRAVALEQHAIACRAAASAHQRLMEIIEQ